MLCEAMRLALDEVRGKLPFYSRKEVACSLAYTKEPRITFYSPEETNRL